MKPSTLAGLKTFLRWFLGVLLLWAAVSKLSNPTEFLASIYAYQLPLPRVLNQLVAVILPWVELLCGLLLLANLWTESALAVAAAMMALFVLATGQAWARDLNISCGCFNLKIFGLHESHPSLVKTVESVGFAFFRNLVLTSLVVYLLWHRLLDLRQPVQALPPKPQPHHPAKKHHKKAGARAR